MEGWRDGGKEEGGRERGREGGSNADMKACKFFLVGNIKQPWLTAHVGVANYPVLLDSW